MLDVAFSSLAAALGSEDDPLESIAVPRLLAVAYAVGWSGKVLSVNPIYFDSNLEAAIEARGDFVDIGAVADTNLATAQGVATNQIQLDAISLYVAMYDTIDSFADRATVLPGVEDGLVDCSSFPHLAKLAGRGGKVSEEKVRSLAGRFRVELPLSTDLTDAAKVKWVWGLASLLSPPRHERPGGSSWRRRRRSSSLVCASMATMEEHSCILMTSLSR